MNINITMGSLMCFAFVYSLESLFLEVYASFEPDIQNNIKMLENVILYVHARLQHFSCAFLFKNSKRLDGHNTGPFSFVRNL